MNVKNGFLNGDISEKVYMKSPPSYPHLSHKVCKLHQALYGLKQTPRARFEKFSTTAHQLGFTSSAYDSALFLRQTTHGYIILLLYVDDMIITGDGVDRISDLKTSLQHHFEIKDLSHLNYFLSLKVLFDRTGYYLFQAYYASYLLVGLGLTYCKITSTPLDSQLKPTVTDGTLFMMLLSIAS